MLSGQAGHFLSFFHTSSLSQARTQPHSSLVKPKRWPSFTRRFGDGMLNINRTKLVAGNWRDFETLLDVTKGRNGLKDPNSRPDHQTHQPRAAIKLKGLDFSLCPSAIGFQKLCHLAAVFSSSPLSPPRQQQTWKLYGRM